MFSRIGVANIILFALLRNNRAVLHLDVTLFIHSYPLAIAKPQRPVSCHRPGQTLNQLSAGIPCLKHFSRTKNQRFTRFSSTATFATEESGCFSSGPVFSTPWCNW
jgi:hypothetical protein